MELFKRYIAFILIFIAVALLWNTVVMYPLKIFVVFMHEVSHGLAAIVTGGEIVSLEVDKHQGGLAVTRGGSRFWILSAGYLGSLLLGGFILLLAAMTHYDKVISVLIGMGMVVITIGFAEGDSPSFFGIHFFKDGNFIMYGDPPSFTYFFGIGFGVVLIFIGLFLSEVVNDWLLRVIGLTSCLYAILDIKSDVLDRSELPSDARKLSEVTPLPTEFWGFLWIIIAIGLTFWFLFIAGKYSASTPVENTDDTPTDMGSYGPR